MSDILKYKNLLTNLRNWNDWDVKHYPLSQNEAEVVTDALMKMVPMKVIIRCKDKNIFYHCPNEDCTWVLHSDWNGNSPVEEINKSIYMHCEMCGQALLWEDDNADKEG